MTRLLIGIVNKRKSEKERRSAYANLSGLLGIICNLLLCAAKFTVGALCGSVSVTADAVNNLSDSASNIVTLAGTRLSDKPVDKEHPFGHGRIEYISALIVAVSVFVVSFELAKSSVQKIIHPEAMKFSAVYVIILVASVLVKLWMAYFNGRLFKLTDNLNLKAVMQDSLNDCVATASTVISLIFSHVFGIQWLDGVIGIGVSVFIFCAGYKILKQVVSPLIGEPPSAEVTKRIEEIITESDIVYGVHDLVIHSYGANKKLASADAEVDSGADIFTVHGVIDTAERRIKSEMNIDICIHMDPVDKADLQTEKYKLITQGVINEFNPSYTFHDFRLIEKDGKKNVTFDLVVPFGETSDSKEIHAEISKKLLTLCPEIIPDFTVEHAYV